MKFCSTCGKGIAEDARFCPGCGAAIAVENKPFEATANAAGIGVMSEAPMAENSVSAPTAATAESPMPNAAPAAQIPAPYAAETPVYPIPGNGAVAAKKKKGTKETAIIIGAVAAVGIILAAVIGAVLVNAAKMKIYEGKIEKAYHEMVTCADYAEQYCSLESKVWYNCIYENASTETDKYTKNKNGRFYDDFNDALSSFYEGESFKYLLVSGGVSTVGTYMSELKDCPEKYEKEYNALKEMYVAFSELTDLVVGSSSYSYNTFSEAFETARSDYKAARRAAKIIIE